ncbi:hypothetical protein [Hoeflea sp.]
MRRASATIALAVPDRFATFIAHALRERHFFDTSIVEVAASTSR